MGLVLGVFSELGQRVCRSLFENIGGSKDHRLLSLRRHARKLFGRDQPPFSEASELVAEIQRLLESEPSVASLKWLYREEISG